MSAEHAVIESGVLLPLPTLTRTLSRQSSSSNNKLDKSYPGSPTRLASPGLPVLGRGLYWTVTQEAGCIPAINYAMDIVDGKPVWWGGEFDAPLDKVEELVKDLPNVLKKGEIESRIRQLPELELFASSTQKSNLDVEFSKSTGSCHEPDCPIAQNFITERQVVVLQTDVQRERAFALYAFLANAYVFSVAPKYRNEPIPLPPVISVPITRLASAVGRQPITDYASCVLNNWELIDINKPFDLDNIRVPRSFTGLVAEKWFFAIHAVIEHRGGLALVNMSQAKESISKFLMMKMLHGGGEGASKRAVALQRVLAHSKASSVQDRHHILNVPNNNSETDPITQSAFEAIRSVGDNLRSLAVSLEGISETMKCLADKCPADEFFDDVRPWVSSWPEPGVIYETYCTCEKGKKLCEPIRLSGASGAQSSLLPSIDGFLGIAYGHKPHSTAGPEHARTDLGAFIRQLKSFRNSMPPQHRDMVARFESQGNVSSFITALDDYRLRSSGSLYTTLGEEMDALKVEFNNCIELLTAFRRIHMDYAVKYIKTMALKRADVAAAAGHSALNSSSRGTGGTDYATHLARHITDTKQSLYNVRQPTQNSSVTNPSPNRGGTSFSPNPNYSPGSFQSPH